MDFKEMPLSGAFLIEPEPLSDERGFFARTYCRREFEEHGLNPNLVQCNISFNIKKGTLRGMHFQLPPHEEVKVVRCTSGAIFDVIIDLRHSSPTFNKWYGMELSAKNRRAFYIPEGFAHGFITLEDSTEVFYQMSDFYQPGSASGVRWDDPFFGVEWPITPCIISERDKLFQDYSP